jgi:hypothetical protein
MSSGPDSKADLPLYCADCGTELSVIRIPDGRTMVAPCSLCCSWHPYPEVRPSHPLTMKYTVGIEYLTEIQKGSEIKIINNLVLGDFQTDNEYVKRWMHIPGSYASANEYLKKMDEERKYPYGRKEKK